MKYLEQIATESFFALTGSLDLSEHHIKSFPKVTPSKGPNLHKFKMAKCQIGQFTDFRALYFNQLTITHQLNLQV